MSSFVKFDQYLLLDLKNVIYYQEISFYFDLPTLSHRAEEIDEIDENFDF